MSTGPLGVDDATGVDHAFVGTDAGYRLEVAVPWSTLGVAPDAGATVGLAVAVNDNDGGDGRDDGGDGAESQNGEPGGESDGNDTERSETAADQPGAETTSSDAGAAKGPTEGDTETDSAESDEESEPGEDGGDSAPAGITGPGFGVVSGVVGAAGGAVLATRRLLDGDRSNGDGD